MGTINYNTNEQVYYARKMILYHRGSTGDLCISASRLFVAGFASLKNYLTIQYKGYNKNKPVWELDFFEHIFCQ